MVRQWMLKTCYEDSMDEIRKTVLYAETREEALRISRSIISDSNEDGIGDEPLLLAAGRLEEVEAVDECAPASDDDVVVTIILRDGQVPRIGRRYILVCKVDSDAKPGSKDEYYLYPDNGEGISGNMNPDIKRYHGFRGSGEWQSTRAEGLHQLREILEVVKTFGYDAYSLKVRLSADLVPDEP